MKRAIAILGLSMLAGLNVGCSRIFGEAAGAALGAKANVRQLDPALDTSQPIGPVTIESITTDMGGTLTRDWLMTLSAELADRLAKDKELNEPGRRAVKLNGVVIHQEEAGLTDQAFGPHPEVVVRVTATDAATGKVIGVANVIGRARSTTSSSQGDLCKAFAIGVNKWLRTADKPK